MRARPTRLHFRDLKLDAAAGGELEAGSTAGSSNPLETFGVGRDAAAEPVVETDAKRQLFCELASWRNGRDRVEQIGEIDFSASNRDRASIWIFDTVENVADEVQQAGARRRE